MKPKRYPGSKPFTLAEKGLFFGRDEDIEGLYNFICVEKLSVLYGKSGLGKTSLLNAGVIPKLETGQNYQIIPVRFGSFYEGSGYRSPLESFVEQIRLENPDSFLNNIEPEDISLWQHLKNRELPHQGKRTQLIVIDQFEELFTYPRGVEEFAEELARLLSGRMPPAFRKKLREQMDSHPDWFTDEQWRFTKKTLNIKVLLSIRSDKMSLLNRLSSFIPNILRDCYELMPLTRSQAEDAIVKPASADGDFASMCFSYEKTSLDKILDYLTQNGEKTVESFQLQILCQYVEENMVIQKEDTSISPEDLGNLENIYQNYYDHHIRLLGTEEEQQAVRVFVEEGLIFEKEERRLTLYEGQIYSVYNINKDLLQRLVNTHLVRSIPDSAGGFSYELSHDTLVAPILKSKSRRKAEERRLEAQKKADEERKERLKKARRRQYRVLSTVGITVLAFIGLLALLAWMTTEREKASQLARSGELIILSLQLQDNATIALRLAEEAYKSTNNTVTNTLSKLVEEVFPENTDYKERNAEAILGIIGGYYTENTFYSKAFAHRLGVGTLVFSPDNKFILSGSDDYTARIWEASSGRELDCLRGHKGPIRTLCFSPKGNLILTGSTDYTARLWERNAGNARLKVALTGHTGTIYAVAFSPDSELILTASRDKTARIWNQNGDLLQILKGHKDMILAATFSPDGQQIFTGSTDGQLNVWNLDGRKIKSLSVQNAGINCFAWSPKDNSLFVGTDEGNIIQFDVSSGEIIGEFNPHQSGVSFISFSPTGDSILSSARDKYAILWQAKENRGVNELMKFRGHTDFIRAGSFSNDGKYIISASNDRTIKLWNLRHEEIDQLKLNSFDGEIVTFLPKKDRLLLGDKHGRVYGIELSTGDTTQFLNAHQKAIRAMAYSQRGPFLVTVSEDSIVSLWRLESNNEFRAIASTRRYTAKINDVAIYVEPKSNQVFVLLGGEDSIATLFDGQFRPLAELKGHVGPITKVAFGPHGEQMLTASTDRTTRVWRLTQDLNLSINLRELGKSKLSVEESQRLVGHSKAVLDACFSPDGNYVLTGSADKTAKLWEIQNGAERVLLKGHQGAINAVAFAASGQFVLTGGEDHLVIEWSLQGQEMKKIRTHQSPIRAVAFSMDSRYLLTSDERGWISSSYSLLESLKEGDIDSIHYVQRRQYNLPGINTETSENLSQGEKNLNQQELRAYAYWNLEKSEGSLSINQLMYLNKAVNVLREVLRKPSNSNIQAQDEFDLARVFVKRLETHLYLYQDRMLEEVASDVDSIQHYAEELYLEAIPFEYAAYLLKDSLKADSVYRRFVQRSDKLLERIQQKRWLGSALKRIVDRFKVESPNIDVSVIEWAQIKINQDLLITNDQLITTKPDQSKKREKRLSAAKIDNKENAEIIEAGDYFMKIIPQATNEDEKEIYLQNALKLYKLVPFPMVSQKLFDVYRKLGEIYIDKSELGAELEKVLAKESHKSLSYRKGFIRTDIGLFSAYMQTNQVDKAKKYLDQKLEEGGLSKELLQDMRPGINKYVNYWETHGGEKINFRPILDEIAKKEPD